MADIVERLHGLADLFEAQQAPHNLVLHMRAGADEIERLRSRLEIDPAHPYDGIYARDETIRGLEKQIASLLNTLADARTESMKLRAALRGVIRVADRDTPEFNEARAALEEGRT